MQRPTRPLVWTFVVSATFVACAAVPDIRFVDAEPGAAGEAGVRDSAPPPADGGAAEAEASAPICSGAQPSGGTCCGQHWCVGQCDLAACADCESQGCGTGEVCCVKPGTVQCKSKCP